MFILLLFKLNGDLNCIKVNASCVVGSINCGDVCKKIVAKLLAALVDNACGKLGFGNELGKDSVAYLKAGFLTEYLALTDDITTKSEKAGTRLRCFLLSVLTRQLIFTRKRFYLTLKRQA